MRRPVHHGMQGIAFFAALCAAYLVLFAASWAGVRRGPPRRALAWATVALALLLAKAGLAWKPVWEAALIPWPDWLFVQGWVLYLIAAVFFGLAVAQLPVRWNRALIAMVALAVLGKGAAHNAWMVSPGRYGEELAPDADHHLAQSTGFTCAPCSAASALSYVGVRATEAEMTELCLTREAGTTVFNTWRGLALKLAGTDWRPRMREASVEELAQPGIVAVIDWPDIRHAVAVRGDGDGLIVHDPLVPRPRRWPIAELRDRYGGVAIVMERR